MTEENVNTKFGLLYYFNNYFEIYKDDFILLFALQFNLLLQMVFFSYSFIFFSKYVFIVVYPSPINCIFRFLLTPCLLHITHYIQQLFFGLPLVLFPCTYIYFVNITTSTISFLNTSLTKTYYDVIMYEIVIKHCINSTIVSLSLTRKNCFFFLCINIVSTYNTSELHTYLNYETSAFTYFCF